MSEPTKIIEENDREITIEWSDESSHTYDAYNLRLNCPCAGCIDEWTGEKRLDPKSVDEAIELSRISIVGRYALNFHFSDGHETGIFSFKFLKDLNGGKK